MCYFLGVRRSRDLAAKISVTAGDIEDFARKHEQHYVVNDVLSKLYKKIIVVEQ